MKNISVRNISDEAYKMLRVEAAWNEKSINQLIVQILEERAEKIKKQRGSEQN